MKERQMAKNYTEIPQKYKDTEGSGLTFTITAGSNTFDIPLTDK